LLSLLPWQLATEFTGWATHLLRLEGGQHQLDALEPGQDIFQRVVVALSAEPFFLGWLRVVAGSRKRGEHPDGSWGK